MSGNGNMLLSDSEPVQKPIKQKSAPADSSLSSIQVENIILKARLEERTIYKNVIR